MSDFINFFAPSTFDFPPKKRFCSPFYLDPQLEVPPISFLSGFNISYCAGLTGEFFPNIPPVNRIQYYKIPVAIF